MTDQWQTVETVESNGHSVDISTVELVIPHGPKHNQDYETCVFWESGSYVLERYEDKDTAQERHTEIVEKVSNGEFEITDREFANFNLVEE